MVTTGISVDTTGSTVDITAWYLERNTTSLVDSFHLMLLYPDKIAISKCWFHGGKENQRKTHRASITTNNNYMHFNQHLSSRSHLPLNSVK